MRGHTHTHSHIHTYNLIITISLTISVCCLQRTQTALGHIANYDSNCGLVSSPLSQQRECGDLSTACVCQWSAQYTSNTIQYTQSTYRKQITAVFCSIQSQECQEEKHWEYMCCSFCPRWQTLFFFFFFFFRWPQDIFCKIDTRKAAHTEKNITGGDRRVCLLAPSLL